MTYRIPIFHIDTSRIVKARAVKVTLLCLLIACFTTVPALAIDFGCLFQADYYGLIDPTTFYESDRMRFTVVPEIMGKSSSNIVSYRLNSVLYFQPVGDPTFTEPERLIREANVGLHFDIFDMYLGQKFVNWGKVDVLSPVNTINHSDNTVLSLDNYFEASVPDLLGQVMVHFSDSLNIEIVYVPFFQPNIDPIEEIVIDRELTISFPTMKTQHYDINAAFHDREIGPFDRTGHSIHGSANYFSDLFDLSGYYSYYIDPFLDFNLSNVEEETVIGVDTDDHFITGKAYPGYNRVHSFGMAGSFYLLDFLISMDGAFKLTQDRDGSQMEIKNSQFFYIVQIERTFLRNVHGQLNLFHRYILNSDATIKSAYSPAVQSYIKAVIDDYLMQEPSSQIYVLMHLDTSFFHEKLLPGANVIYGFSEKGWYYAPRLAYRISDYVIVYTGADIWTGGMEGGFLGRNKENDNFYVRLQLEI